MEPLPNAKGFTVPSLPSGASAWETLKPRKAFGRDPDTAIGLAPFKPPVRQLDGPLKEYLRGTRKVPARFEPLHVRSRVPGALAHPPLSRGAPAKHGHVLANYADEPRSSRCGCKLSVQGRC